MTPLLNTLKEQTDQHMWNEINIMEKIMDLTEEEASQYNSWFHRLPQVKAISEIQKFVAEKQKVQVFTH